PGPERGVAEGPILPVTLRTQLLPPSTPRAGRMELSGRVQDALLLEPCPGDRGGNARHAPGTSPDILLAAQREFLRRVLLRLGRPANAVSGISRPGRESGASAPPRRAGGPVPARARPRGLRALRHRRDL